MTSVEYYFKNYFPSLELKTKATIDLDEAIRVIHAAEGLAVLAHPITFEKKYDVDIDDIFYIFTDAGIDGIEVFNSKHTLSDIKRFYIKNLCYLVVADESRTCRKIKYNR